MRKITPRLDPDPGFGSHRAPSRHPPWIAGPSSTAISSRSKSRRIGARNPAMPIRTKATRSPTPQDASLRSSARACAVICPSTRRRTGRPRAARHRPRNLAPVLRVRRHRRGARTVTEVRHAFPLRDRRIRSAQVQRRARPGRKGDRDHRTPRHRHPLGHTRWGPWTRCFRAGPCGARRGATSFGQPPQATSRESACGRATTGAHEPQNSSMQTSARIWEITDSA